ncbi:MAG: carbon-nitrogen hydrolase family protein [Candidatus Omnitrophica bacterium]|nr:carbon-nitrogen hydrolase family protein [Candidatus Omnitrophota bacterium]
MKTAVIQFNATDNKNLNIKKAVFLVEKAAKAKAKFILLPEVFIYRGTWDEKIRAAVYESIPGPTSSLFCSLAKKYSVHILLGSIYEKSKNSKKAYNSSVLIDNNGRIARKYQKMNLFEAIVGEKKIKESEQFLRGKKPVTAMIGKFKIGLSVCFDLRFPELYRRYYKEGVNVLCVPSAFTKITGQAHWEILLRARAIENLSYVLAPNQIGQDAKGIEYYGHSLIIDPWGRILKEASAEKEEIIYATLDVETIMEKRKKLSINR